MKPTAKLHTFLLGSSLLALLGSPAAQAAPINWGTATTISADTNVLSAGAFGYAYDWNTNNQTVNGVTFTGTNSLTAGGSNVTLSGFNGFNNGNGGTNGTSNYGATTGTFGGLTAAYKGMLAGSNYTTGATAVTVTLNNLTSSHVYATQVWVDDSRANVGLRTETVTSSGGNTVTLAYNSSTTSAGTVGQYTIGRFAADATTQAYTIKGSASTQLNALQVRDVTNIGNWVGTGGATWDASTTNNFASNLYNAALTTTTFAIAKTPLSSVTFADTYWNNGVTTAVTQTAVTIAAGGVSTGTVYFDNSAVNYTISSADANGITGSTVVVKNGSGTVTLSGTHSYTGATYLNGGTLIYNVSNAETLSGVISGAGALTKTGAGSLDLSTATNTYTGATIISAGILRLNSNSSLGGTSSVTIADGASLYVRNCSPTFSSVQSLTLNGTGATGGGALVTSTSGTTTLNGPVSLGSNSLILTGGGTALNIAGTINLNSFTLTSNTGAVTAFSNTISGSGGIAKTGGSTLTLSGTSNYSGGTSVTQGTLGLTGSLADTAITTSGTGIVSQSGAGVISGAASFTQGSTGTSTFAGANVQTYTGATTINAGTLALNYANLTTPTNLLNSGSALVLGGGTLSMLAKNTNTSQTFAGTTLNSGGSAISVTPNGAGAVFVLGAITRNAGSTINFTLPTGTQDSTNGITTTTANTATSILGGWATTGNDWAVTGASGTNNVTALSSYFTYDNVAGWIGASAGATSDMTDNNGYDATYTNSITLNSLRFNASGSDSNLGVVNSNNLTIASGGILVTNNVGAKYQRIGFLNNSFNTGEGQGGLTSSGSELFINQNNSSTGHLEIYSSIFGTGVSLVKSGVGFLDLKGLAASYDGATTINGGTLQVSGGNDRLPTGTTLTINNGTFQLASVNQNVAGLAGSATAIVDNFAGTNTLTVSGAGSNNFAGVIKNTTGTLNLTQSGAGIQTLSGANTYTGTTTVASGTLVISGNQSSATGAVSVNGTLAGSGGTVGGNTTINAGGHLAVGDGTAHSTGKETFTGTLTFASTSIFDWDVSSPSGADPGKGTANGGTYDQVVNTNATKMSGNAVFNVILGTGKSYSDAFWDTDKTWTNVFGGTGVATDLSTIFTSFTDNGTPLIGGLVPGEGTFTINGSSTLTWSAVPEPTSALAGLLLTAGLLSRRRRTSGESAIPNRNTTLPTR